MRRQSPALLSALSLLPVMASAQISDDFSNNLATDLGPLIALFGESMTKQYLSESTTFLDFLILALAPIGILTTVVSVIRVCGSPPLRAFIGRAQEGFGAIEAELCTSTSRDVCELFNKGSITRVLGRPKVLEIIFRPRDTLQAPQPDVKNVRGASEHEIYLFKDYLTRFCGRNLSSESGHSKEDWVSKSMLNPIFPPNPNVTLNIGIQQRPKFVFYSVAVLGISLQLAVLISTGLGTFRYGWIETAEDAEDRQTPINAHDAAIAFILGTITLTARTFACATLIGRRTAEVVYYRRTLSLNTKKASKLFWIQPGNQIVGDQTFDAFAYSEPENKVLQRYTSSRMVDSEDAQDSAVLTWLAVIVATGGFICRFIGLRGLGPWVALSH